MKKSRSIHVSFVSRTSLTGHHSQRRSIGGKQQNVNSLLSSGTNRKSLFKHSVSPQPLTSTSLRTPDDQSSVVSPNISNNISSKNCLTNSNKIGFIISLEIILATFVLISLVIGIYGLIYINKTTTTTANVMTTTTTIVHPIIIITQAGDPIVGICNTIAGGSTGGSNVNYPAAETPPNAIDNSTNTKYTNFGNTAAGCSGSSAAGLDTGFYITPNISSSSIATGLLFATANDNPTRDPITVTLEGTNAVGTVALNSGSSWTLIYNGSTGINATVDPGRFTYVPQQNFSNTITFSSYRLLVTSKRSADICTQYSEAHIIGYI